MRFPVLPAIAILYASVTGADTGSDNGPAVMGVLDHAHSLLDQATGFEPVDRLTALQAYLTTREAESFILGATSITDGEGLNIVVRREALQRRSAALTAAQAQVARFCDDNPPRLCLLAEAENAASEVSVSSRILLRLSIAASYAAFGEIAQTRRIWEEEARMIADIPDSNQQIRLLLDLARAQAESGAYDAARSTLMTAETIVATIEFAALRGGYLSSIGNIYADAGYFDDAERLLALINPEINLENAFVDVVGALVAVGEFARAERIADRINSPLQRAAALGSIAKAMNTADQIEDAKRLRTEIARSAAVIDDPPFRDAAYAVLAKSLIEAENLSGAQQVARGCGQLT